MQDVFSPDLWRVKDIIKETEDTFTLALVPSEEKKKFSFSPGQFNMLYYFAVGEAPISISGADERRNILFHTIRRVGGVTQALGSLKKGEFLGLRGPFGNSWQRSEAKGKDIFIVAGGLGLAPLRPFIRNILKERQNYGKVIILYGARNPSLILYKEELSQWRSRLDISVEVSVDTATRLWRGNVGVISDLISRYEVNKNSFIFICGPEIMMKVVAREFLEKGADERKIFLSLERNMNCGIGLCGHCQCGEYFVCKDGPIFSLAQISNLINIREV